RVSVVPDCCRGGHWRGEKETMEVAGGSAHVHGSLLSFPCTRWIASRPHAVGAVHAPTIPSPPLLPPHHTPPQRGLARTLVQHLTPLSLSLSLSPSRSCRPRPSLVFPPPTRSRTCRVEQTKRVWLLADHHGHCVIVKDLDRSQAGRGSGKAG